jgi:hypothetical protein
MKRNSKPFSVEIKKSRLQTERIQLPPKRLFEGFQAENSRIFEKEVSKVVAEPSAPSRRILPSIIEPFSSSSEPVETVAEKRSASITPQSQIQFDWLGTAPEDGEDESTQAPVKVEVASDVTVAATVEEAVVLVRAVQSAERDSAPTTSRKARTKTYKPAEEVTPPASTERPFRASDRRQIDRQAAAVQLPRQERWKRRLPTAAW